MGKGLYHFWLGAEGDLGASSGSSSLRSPEPVPVSAHSGDDPARFVGKDGIHYRVWWGDVTTTFRPSPTEWR